MMGTSMNAWTRKDGVEMIGQYPRHPGAHFCKCWFYDCRVEPYEAMCGAEFPKDYDSSKHPPDYHPRQLLHLSNMAKPEDCEKCRVLFVQAMLEGNLYHHTIHEATQHTLALRREREAQVKALEEQIRLLTSRLQSPVGGLRLLLEKLPKTTTTT